MTNPAVIIVAGAVVTVAAVIAFFSLFSPQPQAYSSKGPGNGTRNRRPSPPPSPPPSSFTRRRRSPERRRRSPKRQSNLSSNEFTRESTEEQCINCGESPFVKIQPCNHKSLCRGCAPNRLKTNATCPVCKGRIDSCLPEIPPFSKCEKCCKFTEVFQFLPCNHSLSLCISCFEKEGKSLKECPECHVAIRSSKPAYHTSGSCTVCKEFAPFAIFQPCGHRCMCRKHANLYLKSSGQECIDCGSKIMKIE